MILTILYNITFYNQSKGKFANATFESEDIISTWFSCLQGGCLEFGLSLLFFFFDTWFKMQLIRRNHRVNSLLIRFNPDLLFCWPTESPVKRKRGRPKGSTKKTRLTDDNTDSTHPANDSGQREEEGGNNEEGDRQYSSTEGS